MTGKNKALALGAVLGFVAAAVFYKGSIRS